MDLLDLYTYYFELPLYSKLKINEDTDEQKVFELMWSEKGIDAYNPSLKENTTYFIVPPNAKYFTLKLYNGLILTKLSCTRTKEVLNVVSWLDFEDRTIQKIGQYPSIAHFHISKIRNYQKVLDTEKLKELTRAIGLAANGVGIGSFVYLRRIFEYLLEKEHQKAKISTGWDEEIYSKSKVVERIELLKDYLPSFLSENKTLYGILSIGIHSLKEEECLQYFEAVKVGIELILDEEFEKYKKAQKLLEAKKKIDIVTQQIKENK